MINATEIKKGMVLNFEGQLWVVLSYEHITPGNWRAMVKARLRNLKTGNSKEQRFSANDRVDVATIEQKEMEFLYAKGDQFLFMDLATYEECSLSRELLADAAWYLLPNTEVKVNLYEGAAVSVELPTTVALLVKETDPVLKGSTVTNQFKPATLETGLVVQIPSFVSVGERVRVDTRDGSYVERVR